MYTRVHDRLHVLCRCGRRKEGARAYIYICTMVEERCVSRSIFITCLERRRGGCSSETYESQRTRMQRTIVPAFQPANRNALSTLLSNLGLRRSSGRTMVRFHASSSFTIRKYCSRLKRVVDALLRKINAWIVDYFVNHFLHKYLYFFLRL